MKKRTLILRISAVIISIALIAAMALCMASCGKAGTQTDSSLAQTGDKADASAPEKTSFKFSVKDSTGKTESYTISTEKTTLGEALLEAGIITEEEQKTGFINTVNGVTLNWDTDKAYWALYAGDSYAQKGVNETEISAGDEYSFVYTKE